MAATPSAADLLQMYQIVRATPRLVSEACAAIEAVAELDELREEILGDLAVAQAMAGSTEDWPLTLGPLATVVRTLRYAAEACHLPMAARLRQHEDALLAARDVHAQSRKDH